MYWVVRGLMSFFLIDGVNCIFHVAVIAWLFCWLDFRLPSVKKLVSLVNNKLVKNKLKNGLSKRALLAYFIVLHLKSQKCSASLKEIV